MHVPQDEFYLVRAKRASRVVNWFIMSVSSQLPSTHTFRRSGDVWTIEFDDELLQLHDRKGLHYLATLLGQPSEPMHVLELISRHGGTGTAGLAVFGDESVRVRRALEDRELAVDATSLVRYRRRAAELREALEEAEAHCDLGRAQQAARELSFLKRELARSLRARSTSTERARKAVYNRLREEIRRIAGFHPTLGHHLTCSIRTGEHCCYRPERACTWVTGVEHRRRSA